MDAESISDSFRERIPALKLLESEAREMVLESCVTVTRGFKLESRTKELDSFVKKALSGKYDDPMIQIQDMVGIRIVVDYHRDIERILEAVKRHLYVQKVEVKSFLDEDAYNAFGYEGVHCIAAIPNERMAKIWHLHGDSIKNEFEIQIQTRAQNAWNDLSHKFLYKGSSDLPLILRRKLVRLMALMEIFDQEVNEVVIAAESIPATGIEGLIRYVSAMFEEMSGEQYNRILTSQIIHFVTYHDDRVAENMKVRVSDFINANYLRLKQMFDHASRNSGVSILLSQPEAMVILAELHANPLGFVRRWKDEYSTILLRDIAQPFDIRILDDDA